MPEENTILEENDIKVTNLRAVFGAKTYSVSNITAVENKKLPPSACLPLILIGIGLVVAALALDDIGGNIGTLLFGLLSLGGGIAIAATAKPLYTVQISTASGEIKAFTSGDKAVIDRIVDALNNAIVQKG